jgi:hypothetical protein
MAGILFVLHKKAIVIAPVTRGGGRRLTETAYNYNE